MRCTLPCRILFLLTLLIAFTTNAQRSVLDSLQNEFARHRNDLIGVRILSLISAEFTRKDISKAKEFLYQGITLAKRLHTDHGLSACYTLLTTQHQNSGNIDSAMFYLDKLRLLAEKYPKGNDVVANYHLTSGLFHKNRGELEIALKHMVKALDFMTSPSAEISKAGQYLNIGNTYLNLGDIPSAADHHLKGLRLFEKLGNKRGQSFCLQSLGSDFLKLKRYDESQKYYKQALAIKAELKDTRGMISAWIGLGTVSSESGKPGEAELYYSRALKTATELNLTLEQARTLLSLGLVQKVLKKIPPAQSSLTRGLALARQHGDSLLVSRFVAELMALSGDQNPTNIQTTLINKMTAARNQSDKIATAEAYLNLSEWNFENKHYRKAFEMLKLYHQVNDSVRGEEVLVQLKRFEEQYQNEKKEKEIALLKKDQELKEAALARQQANQQIIMIVLVSIIIITIILVNQYRIINRTKRLIEIEKVRNSIARDLHDDIGSALSSIHIMSQVAMKEKDGSSHHLQRISENASRMMDSMNDIVWSISPENDSLGQMIIKMKEFASEILEPRNIRYVFDEGDDLNSTRLDLDQRKNLFLIYKESINNAAKYSEGTEVVISLKRTADTLSLVIRDNGKGFEKANVRNGNGLTNMKERARIMRGRLVHSSAPGKGTEVLAELPVT